MSCVALKYKSSENVFVHVCHDSPQPSCRVSFVTEDDVIDQKQIQNVQQF